MSKEIKARIEKALEVLSWCQENADEKWMVDHLALVRTDIDQALELLKQQPSASQLTKDCRKLISGWDRCLDQRKVRELCDRLDRAEASAASSLQS